MSRDIEGALKAGQVSWWFMELPSGDIEFNPTKAERLGYDAKDFTHYEDFTKLIHPDDYEPTMQAMRDYLDGQTPTYMCSYRIKAADGSWHRYADQGVVQSKKGKNITLFGATVDVG